MNPFEVMLWALAGLVVVCCVALAVAFVVGAVRSLGREKASQDRDVQVFDGRRGQ